MVLVVEDDPFLLEALSELLSLNGYRVTTTCNGCTAIDLAQSIHPDAILCDVGIPMMDGFEVFDQLQRFSATSTIPFVFVTGWSNIREIQGRIGIKTERILLKPFSADDLLETLLSVWEVHDEQSPCPGSGWL
jgi:CheY-like chemotaxis protein